MAQFSVIQIDPNSEVRKEFKGKLAVVDEIKTWGCIAYVETFTGRAYIRLQAEQYDYIGELAWIPTDESDEEEVLQ